MRDLSNRLRRIEARRGDVLARMTDAQLDALIADLESQDASRIRHAITAVEGASPISLGKTIVQGRPCQRRATPRH